MEPKEEILQPQGPPANSAKVSPKSEEISIAGRRISRLGDRLVTAILDNILRGVAFAVIVMLIGVPPPVSAKAHSTVVSGDLKIVNFEFTESKDGPIRPEAPYKPGDKVYIDYSVTGYSTDPNGKVNLISTVTILDPSGLPLYPPLKRELHEAVPKLEKPIEVFFNYYFDLPYYAPGGKYNIHIKLHDSVKNRDSESIQPFIVEAPPIAPSTRLEFRDFYFSLSEDGPPVAQPVIQPGGTIYSLCKVFGIRFRDHRPNLNISLKVIGPKGEVVAENPNLISINEQRFYRPATFFERISAWVRLPPKASKGRYTWKYTMTDKIANTRVDYEANFEVK